MKYTPEEKKTMVRFLDNMFADEIEKEVEIEYQRMEETYEKESKDLDSPNAQDKR